MQNPELSELIRESFLTPEKKAELERLLANAADGEDESVLRALQTALEADIASRAERFKGAYNGLERSFGETDSAFDAAKQKLEEETEAKLHALADDDFDARDAVWEQYDKELERLDKERQESLRAAATVALMS